MAVERRVAVHRPVVAVERLEDDPHRKEGLARPRGARGRAAHAQVQRLRGRHVDAVRERRHDEARRRAAVLVAVRVLALHHADHDVLLAEAEPAAPVLHALSLIHISEPTRPY